MTFEPWLREVEEALSSINMPMQDWQRNWEFDFRKEFTVGTAANDAAMKANRYWWYRQNQAIGRGCNKTRNCWDSHCFGAISALLWGNDETPPACDN